MRLLMAQGLRLLLGLLRLLRFIGGCLFRLLLGLLDRRLHLLAEVCCVLRGLLGFLGFLDLLSGLRGLLTELAGVVT